MAIFTHRNLMSVNDVDGNVVELVELIYALHEMKRIDNGEIAMNELAGFFGEVVRHSPRCAKSL